MHNQLSLNLRSMQLRKIKRAEKKGTESVMDEKFALLFLTQFKIADQLHTAWTLSLPVVAVVHGNQEPHAWATVTWDNAFADPVSIDLILKNLLILSLFLHCLFCFFLHPHRIVYLLSYLIE